MKRAIIVQVRMQKDKKTNDDIIWVTSAIMPSKSEKGDIFYPLSKNTLVTTCANALRSPDKYNEFKKLRIGDLIDIHYDLNEYKQQLYVSKLELVKQSSYKEEELIV